MAQDPLNSPLEVNIKQEFQYLGNQKYSGNFKEAHEGILKEETLFAYAPDSPKLIKDEVEEDGKEPKEEICSETFLDYSSIKQEELIIKDDVDQNRKRFNVTALECDRKLTSFHRTNTGKAVMYICDQCNFQTVRKHSLKEHRLIHRKPEEAILYQCSQCDYETIWKHYLTKHYRIHKKTEGAVIYKCDQCDYQTIWKSSLPKHYVLHKKPEDIIILRCDQCDYQTHCKSYLKRHSLTHKKPGEIVMYKCDRCNYQAVRKYQLKRHHLIHEKSDRVVTLKCDQSN